MKKIIMALVCATVSLTMMAQPKDKKDNNDQPRMEQGCPMHGPEDGQGCPEGGQMQGCPMQGPAMGCPMQNGMQPMKVGDVAILKQIGVDTTKIKQVKEMKQQNRKAMQELQEKHNKAKKELKDEYNKNLRQLLGDETYIKFLEAKVAQNQVKGNKGMKRMGKGMRQGNRKGQPGKRPMNPGMKPDQNHHDKAQKPEGKQGAKDKSTTKSKKNK